MTEDMVITGPVAGDEAVITHVPLPNDARIAVNFTLAFEAWSPGGVGVSALGSGIPAELQAKGVRDWATISSQEYGGRAGIWRLLGTLEENDVVATCSTSGYVAERWPAALKALTEGGHEIVGHGYFQDGPPQYSLDEDEDLAAVTRTTEALEAASGQRPVGWSSHAARRGEHTIKSLFKNDYLYSGDFREADVPFVVAQWGERKLYAVPRTDEINDMTLQRINAGPPSFFVEYFQRTFDQLYKEGATHPSTITSVFHAIIAGRPWGAGVLTECIRYVKQFPDVWICTRRQLVENHIAHSGE